jgi:GTPase SAR1 family protein
MKYVPSSVLISFTNARDTAGSERFAAVTSSYYRGSHGVFLGAAVVFY